MPGLILPQRRPLWTPPRFWTPRSYKLINDLDGQFRPRQRLQYEDLWPTPPPKSPYSITYLGSIQFSSGTTITGSIDIGAADADKEIFVTSAVVCSSGSPTLTAASSTVAGSAVTKATSEGVFAQTSFTCAFVALPSASGSQTVTMTYAVTLAGGWISVYKVISRPNKPNNQTDASTGNVASGTTLTVNATTINDNGIWLAAHRHGNNNATTGPTGTVINDSDSDAGANRYQFSHRIPEATNTPSDVWSWTGSVLARSYSWAFD